MASRVTVPSNILVSNVGEEAVILNLDSERYYGLDPVGARMWAVLNISGTVRDAYETLLAEFDVDGEQLRRDLIELVVKLNEQGLLDFSNE